MSLRSRRQDSYRQQSGFRKLRLESLEARLPLAADFHLLSDVNQKAEALGADIDDIVVIGDTAYFSANDGVTGRELWKSDGTPEGTVRVKDIFPGDKGSNPAYLTEFEGVLYFAASDRDDDFGFIDNGDVELWQSDGTEAGTYRVKEIIPGIRTSGVSQLMNVGGTLYFSASFSTLDTSRRLWKSDGSESGTEAVIIPNSFDQPEYPTLIGAAGDALLFAIDGHLWRSDGTGAGTYKLRDFSSDYYSWNRLRVLGTSEGNAYFAANDEAAGFSMWKTDGTIAGTTFIHRIQSNNLLEPPTLAVIGDTLIFGTSDPVHGHELWKSDGTPEGTALLKDIWPGYSDYTSPWEPTPSPYSSSPYGFTNVNGIVYFLIVNDFQVELWRTNGTNDGTFFVKQLPEFAGNHTYSILKNVAGRLLLSSLSDGRSDPWISDGTEVGTVRLKDISAGAQGSFAKNFTELNGNILFTAHDEIHGEELWLSDGTEVGTNFVKDILPATADSSPSLVTNVAGAFFFKANNGAVGEELWTSGGDASSTRLVKDIRPGLESSQINYLTEVGGTLFFTADDGVSGVELWKSDGTAEGTGLVRDVFVGPGGSGLKSLVNVNGTLYFSANDGARGVELWKSDGTAAGTVRVKDISAGAAGSSADNLVNVGGVLYFSANDGIAGHELWKSDGTELGTILVKDIYPGSGGSIAAQLINIGSMLYFSAKDSNSNGELWKSDGTEAGTMLVKDIVPGPNGSWPHGFANINGELYFSTSKEFTNGELWKSKGTETVIVKAPIFSLGASTMSRMAVGQIGTTTFVVELGWYNGPSSLWSTDGTEAGTAILVYRDLISSFTMWGDYLYFTRYGTQSDRPYDLELWRSDGTRAGTELVKDFSNGYRSSFSGWDTLKVINDRLVLIRNTDRYGAELWISDPPAASQPGDYDANGGVDGADFLAWQRGFGGAAAPAGSGADGDGSGAVDAGDLGVWAEHFGQGSASGAAAGLAAETFAVQEAAPSLFASLEAVEAESAYAVALTAAGDHARANVMAAGDLAALAQREASGRDALGGHTWERAAVRREEVAEASSPRRAVADGLDAAFASLGASRRNARWGGMIDASEFDEAAACLKEAKPQAGGLAFIGAWGKLGEGSPGR